MVVLEANLDDVTGEQLAHAVGALLDAGAHDAWVTPVVMKKGRPGHVVHALGDPALARRSAQVLQSSTGHVRRTGHHRPRWPAPGAMEEVEVDGASRSG